MMEAGMMPEGASWWIVDAPGAPARDYGVDDPYLAASLYYDAMCREFSVSDHIRVRRAHWSNWRGVVTNEERIYLVRWGRVVSPLALEEEE